MCLLTVSNCQLMVGHWHQFKCQQESPIWGVVKKETLFRAKYLILVQQGSENRMAVRQPWVQLQPWVRLWVQLCSDLLGLVCPALLCPSLPRCYSDSALLCSGKTNQGNLQSSVERESELPELEGSLLIYTEVPASGPLIGLSSCKRGLQIPPFFFIGPKDTYMIGKNGGALIGW